MRIRLDDLLLRILLGRRWKEKLWITKRDKSELETQLLIRTAPVLTNAWGLDPVAIPVDAEYPCFNPSIARTPTGYRVVARSSNLVNLNDGNYHYPHPGRHHQTVNFLVDLDSQLRPLSQRRLQDSAVVAYGLAAEYGLEDVRLFEWAGGTWACAAALRPVNGSGQIAVQQVLARLEGDALVDVKLLPSPYEREVEKNWAPIVYGGDLSFAYSLAPLEILNYTPENNTLSRVPARQQANGTFHLRGGTPFIPWKGHLLGVAHSSPLHHQGKRYYTHHFITLNSALEIVEVSEPFFIQRRGTEFASGIVAADDGIILAYGVADRACRLLHIPDRVLGRFLTL